MSNRIRESNIFNSKLNNYTIDVYYNLYRSNALNFQTTPNDDNWTKDKELAFLCNLCMGFPIPSTVLGYPSQDNPNAKKETNFIDVVGGKQLIQTLFKVFNNEIPLPLGKAFSELVFYKDLQINEQRAFNNIVIPCYQIESTVDSDYVRYHVFTHLFEHADSLMETWKNIIK